MRPHIFLLLVLVLQAQANIQGCLVQLSSQLVSSSINLHTPGVESAGGGMVCSAWNVLQAHKASSVQSVQQLFGTLETSQDQNLVAAF